MSTPTDNTIRTMGSHIQDLILDIPPPDPPAWLLLTSLEVTVPAAADSDELAKLLAREELLLSSSDSLPSLDSARDDEETLDDVRDDDGRDEDEGRDDDDGRDDEDGLDDDEGRELSAGASDDSVG